MKFLIVLFMLFSSYAFSEDGCSDVQVNTESMPKNNDQGPLAWCFAWSAADLLSYHEKIPLSAYDIAIQYHSDYFKKNLIDKTYSDEAGFSYRSIQIALKSKRGVCLEKDTDFKNSNWVQLDQMIIELDNRDKSLINIICDKGYQNSLPFKNISTSAIEILNTISNIGRLPALMDISCMDRYKVKNHYIPSNKSIKDSTPESIMKQLDDVLSKNAPATIYYNADILFQGPDVKRTAMNHASTIIGRRMNSKTNQCEYLLKNSWGNECIDNNYYECSNGNSWIPQKTLLNNVDGVDWLAPN